MSILVTKTKSLNVVHKVTKSVSRMDNVMIYSWHVDSSIYQGYLLVVERCWFLWIIIITKTFCRHPLLGFTLTVVLTRYALPTLISMSSSIDLLFCGQVISAPSWHYNAYCRWWRYFPKQSIYYKAKPRFKSIFKILAVSLGGDLKMRLFYCFSIILQNSELRIPITAKL